MATKLLIFCLFSILLFPSYSYSKNNIDTWNKFCDHILEKNNDSFITSFNYPAIRNDFIKQYNKLVIQNIAYFYLDGMKPDDKVVKEMERLKMIGVELKDNNIIINNSFLVNDKELQEWKARYTNYINASKSNTNQLDDYQTCMYDTINSFFDKLIIKGSDQKQTSIKLEFNLKPKL